MLRWTKCTFNEQPTSVMEHHSHYHNNLPQQKKTTFMPHFIWSSVVFKTTETDFSITLPRKKQEHNFYENLFTSFSTAVEVARKKVWAIIVTSRWYSEKLFTHIKHEIWSGTIKNATVATTIFTLWGFCSPVTIVIRVWISHSLTCWGNDSNVALIRSSLGRTKQQSET